MTKRARWVILAVAAPSLASILAFSGRAEAKRSTTTTTAPTTPSTSTTTTSAAPPTTAPASAAPSAPAPSAPPVARATAAPAPPEETVVHDQELTPAPAPAPAPTVAPPAPKLAPPPTISRLPRTGPGSRLLVVVSGAALALGGLGLTLRPPASRPRR